MDWRVFSSVRLAWAVAAALLLALAAVMVLGLIGWPALLGSQERLSYAAASQLRAAEDKSQPLHMLLEARYPGPLQDTTIERWRDPVDDTICYIYLPVAVPHTAGPNGLVQYGAANIGTISCFGGRSN